MKIFTKIGRKAISSGNTWLSNKASTALITAICVPVLLGFAAMSVDIGYWYAQKSALNSLAAVSSMAATRAQLYGMTNSQSVAMMVEEEAGFSWPYASIPQINVSSSLNSAQVNLNWNSPFFLSEFSGIGKGINENIESTAKIYLTLNGTQIVALSK